MIGMGGNGRNERRNKITIGGDINSAIGGNRKKQQSNRKQYHDKWATTTAMGATRIDETTSKAMNSNEISISRAGMSYLRFHECDEQSKFIS
jgi:hypothetical protein